MSKPATTTTPAAPQPAQGTQAPAPAAAPQAQTTPASGGRYMRAEDGTLTPIEE